MNCIVTCGPTCEPLDQVRRLTNFSTGRLGTELANYLVGQGNHVTLLRGEAATYPGPVQGDHLAFTSTEDLQARLSNLAGPSINAVFHTAAVADFRFGAVFRKNASGPMEQVTSGKFSTRDLPLFVELVPTPKILPRLATWFPNALRVGWKYEVDGRLEEALARGRAQLAEAQTHACVVNGPACRGSFWLLHAQDQIEMSTREGLYENLWSLIKAVP